MTGRPPPPRAAGTRARSCGGSAWFQTRRCSPPARTTRPPGRPAPWGSAPRTRPSAPTVPPKPLPALVLEVARLGLRVTPGDAAIRMVAEPAHVPFLAEAPGEDCSTVVLGAAPARPGRRPRGRTSFETDAVL